MEEMSVWARDISEAASGLAGQMIAFLPTLIGALAVLFAGWLIARVLRSAIIRISLWFNRLVDRRLTPERALHFKLSNTGVKLVGNVAYWVVILAFVTIATDVLGLEAFSHWLDRVLAYLPTLLVGGLIVVVGFLVSALARELTSATVASAGIQHAELFGRGVQAAILATALVIGINQVGIDVTLLIALIAIIVGALMGSLALAFALGARTLVSNLIGAHYLQQQFQPGQQARIGGVTGEILELTPMSVILATEEGRLVVPAKTFGEETTALLSGAARDE